MARPGRPEQNRTARSFRQLRRFHDVINSDKVFSTHSALSKVVDFMEANVGENLTLRTIAKLVDLSPRQLRRAFVAATGVGPSEMFTNIRLERAARELRQSSKSVTEISLDCGFSQPQHLATAFRRKFGVTPTEFRRN